MHQAELSDSQVVLYVSDMLLQFLHTENLYPYEHETGAKVGYISDMIQLAEQADLRKKQEIYQHVGDYVLFVLGVFPESLEKPRRNVSPSFYTYHGRRSYMAASELHQHSDAIQLCRKMASQFERCVLGLNWFREYTSDPFYQYMFREFSIGT
ncbi:MAG: hypothetical protein HYX74_08340 [Acidobacteria bacterium]|nr:hypothetical protein [Acidobacteriota bacterium]